MLLRTINGLREHVFSCTLYVGKILLYSGGNSVLFSIYLLLFFLLLVIVLHNRKLEEQVNVKAGKSLWLFGVKGSVLKHIGEDPS